MDTVNKTSELIKSDSFYLYAIPKFPSELLRMRMQDQRRAMDVYRSPTMIEAMLLAASIILLIIVL